jgi:hypothetical protein
LLVSRLIAQNLISRFPLKINSLHEYYGSMTSICRFFANAGAPVDVRIRMGRGFADG